jgi:nickel/cobalt exporter
MAEKQYSDIEKLQMMITHWLQHNESHGREYAKWAAVARGAGNNTAAEYIEQAVMLLAEADKTFAKALEAVGGPGRGHAEHGHHHHD